MADKKSASAVILTKLTELDNKITQNSQSLMTQINENKNSIEQVIADLANLKKTNEENGAEKTVRDLSKDIQNLVEIIHAQNAETKASIEDLTTIVNHNIKPLGAGTSKKAEPKVEEPEQPEQPEAAAAAVPATATKKAPAGPKNAEAYFKKAYKENAEGLKPLLTEDLLKECKEADAVKSKKGAPKKTAEAIWLWENKFKDKESKLGKAVWDLFEKEKK